MGQECITSALLLSQGAGVPAVQKFGCFPSTPFDAELSNLMWQHEGIEGRIYRVSVTPHPNVNGNDDLCSASWLN